MKRYILVSIMLGLAGCGGSSTELPPADIPTNEAPPVNQALYEVQSNRALWLSSYQEFYSYDQDICLECSDEDKKFSFFVESNDKHVFNNNTKRFSDFGEYEITSIEDVFDLIEASVQEADSFSITYDSTIGYPTSVVIDMDPNTAEDDIIFSLSNVVTDLDSCYTGPAVPVWQPSITVTVVDAQTDENISCSVDVILNSDGANADIFSGCSNSVEFAFAPIASYQLVISKQGYNAETIEFDLMRGLCTNNLTRFSRHFDVSLSPQ